MNDIDNNILRRIDGRFLTPNPYPQKSICFAENELSIALGLISKSVIRSKSKTSDCDLAVAVDPDQTALESLWSSLKPGGSCYIEWNIDRLTNLDTLKKKLSSSGYENISFYFLRPSPDIALVKSWIPLASKRGIEFWSSLEFSYSQRNHKNRLKLFLKRCYVKFISFVVKMIPGLINPGAKRFIICSTAHKPDTHPESIINENQDEHSNSTVYIKNGSNKPVYSVFEKLDEYYNGRVYSILMKTEGWTVVNKAILYIFLENEKTPSCIVKMRRLNKAKQRMENEADILEELHTKHGDLNVSPKLLFFDNVQGYSYLGESYTAGTVMYNVFNYDNYGELSMKATELLINLDTATRKDLPDNWKDKLIEPIITKFKAYYESILEPKVINRTADLIDNIEMTHTTLTHADYCHWNIILKPDGELALIDWEYSTIEGFPVIDLIFFFTFLTFELKVAGRGNRYLSCYRDLLDESTDIGKVFKYCLNYYCTKVGVPESAVPVYRLLIWVIVLNRYYETYNIVNEGEPKIESLLELTELELFKEEIRRLSKTQDLII